MNRYPRTQESRFPGYNHHRISRIRPDLLIPTKIKTRHIPWSRNPSTYNTNSPTPSHPSVPQSNIFQSLPTTGSTPVVSPLSAHEIGHNQAPPLSISRIHSAKTQGRSYTASQRAVDRKVPKKIKGRRAVAAHPRRIRSHENQSPEDRAFCHRVQ